MADLAVEQLARRLAKLPETERIQALQLAEKLPAEDDQAAEPPIQTLGDWLDIDMPVQPTLVGHVDGEKRQAVLVRGEVSAMIARAGYGKSHLSLGRIMRWGAGMPMFHNLTTHYMPDGPVKTLVVENEGAHAKLHENLRRYITNDGQFGHEQRQLARENVLIWGDANYQSFRLDATADEALLRRGIERWEPDHVFLEPFSRLWDGDENSTQEMRRIFNLIASIAAEYQVAISVVHHAGKRVLEAGEDPMSMARGSTILEGDTAYFEVVSTARGADRRILTSAKDRWGSTKGLTWEYEWLGDDAGYYRYVPQEEGQLELLDALECWEGQTISALSEHLGRTQKQLHDYLHALEDRGQVRREGGGRSPEYFKVCHANETGMSI